MVLIILAFFRFGGFKEAVLKNILLLVTTATSSSARSKSGLELKKYAEPTEAISGRSKHSMSSTRY